MNIEVFEITRDFDLERIVNDAMGQASKESP